MFAKIKNTFNQIPWKLIHDVRAIGLTAFLVIMLLMSWSGVKVIQSNYSLQKQISALEQQNQVQTLQNANLKLQNQYFNTNQFLELSARQNFGLAAPGETELIVPNSVALAHVTNIPASESTNTISPSSHQPAYQRHLQAWVNFYLHRQSADD